ncbi:uncharacterized protein LY79DRAFT_673586 [Colletotrichum navitas]|uniref:Uncharacterized protein n=1 Tax=Colletotrichum navitas TaxID=681940 RepID=A0AAD8UY90_9PEZI|nr:uncharacterized protein LY79DRAFT_673586 [Colletotrichum navitas]KAK1573491.1 hypothetical protein LY79DRAFT_673586 [Colletotrichum navitas]
MSFNVRKLYQIEVYGQVAVLSPVSRFVSNSFEKLLTSKKQKRAGYGAVNAVNHTNLRDRWVQFWNGITSQVNILSGKSEIYTKHMLKNQVNQYEHAQLLLLWVGSISALTGGQENHILTQVERYWRYQQIDGSSGAMLFAAAKGHFRGNFIKITGYFQEKSMKDAELEVFKQDLIRYIKRDMAPIITMTRESARNTDRTRVPDRPAGKNYIWDWDSKAKEWVEVKLCKQQQESKAGVDAEAKEEEQAKIETGTLDIIQNK